MAKIKFNKVIREEVPETKAPVDNIVSTVDNTTTTPEKEPRKAGRPKNGSVSGKVVPLDVTPNIPGGVKKDETKDSPATVTPIESATGDKAKRGRKPKTKAESTNLSVDALTKQVYGLHQMLNVFIPGTAIEQGQAAVLAEALAEVIDAFDVKINRKVSSLVMLAATVAIVEIPVMVKVRNNAIIKKAGNVAKNNVVQMKKEMIASGEPPKVEIPRPQMEVAPAMNSGYAIAEGVPIRG